MPKWPVAGFKVASYWCQSGQLLVPKWPVTGVKVASNWPLYPEKCITTHYAFCIKLHYGFPPKCITMHYAFCITLHYGFLQKCITTHYTFCITLHYGFRPKCITILYAFYVTKTAPAPCSAQPIPAHQTDLHLIPHPLASNHRPMQVKRYEPLCGSCTPKGCYLLTCRGHPLHSSAFPLDPFPASRPHGRDAAQNGLRSDASESRFDPDFSPHLKQQIFPFEATYFPS